VGDWQLSARGDWGFDIAYCITSSLTVKDRREWLHELLRFYLERLRESGGPAIGLDEALSRYRQHLFTSLAWWTPCVNSEFVYHPQKAVIEMVNRITTAMDDMNALDAFD
jgi:Ecdysteroid kinase-like family